MIETSELLTVMQVGTELGVSASSVGKLVKEYPGWVQATRKGRSIFYTDEALKRLKLIRKLQEQKKTKEYIEKMLAKKFEPVESFGATNQLGNDSVKITENVSRSGLKAATGLIKQVKKLESQVLKLEIKVQELSTQLALHRKSNLGQPQLTKIEQELKRLAKILEG